MTYRYCYLERQAVVHDILVERKVKQSLTGFILTVWGVDGKGFRQPFIECDEDVSWIQMVKDNEHG